LIQQNYSDPSLCIDSIASKIGLSADYLSRIYRQETGTSILERIISVRMDRARAMLSTTSETIQIIASSVGYINLSYFYKLFKKENGVTPAEYRKRHRKEGN
jgi:YesN/AraC family two-component response regulator